ADRVPVGADQKQHLELTRDTLDGLLGPNERWTDEAAALDPSRSVGDHPDVAALRLLADDLVPLLAVHAPRLIPATSREEWDRARMYARTATGLLRYHAGMAEPSAARVARLLGLRDAMMADNLEAVAPHGPALVFAHNRHLQREPSTWRLAGMELEWWSAGPAGAAGRALGERAPRAGGSGTRLEGAGVSAPWPSPPRRR
ncbi:erythromycin esterase family protein, partial [Nonomuraea sp. NPDC004297]